ncbi:hypothetical protein LCGC14_3133900, partial [marine sediment metagenome]
MGLETFLFTTLVTGTITTGSIALNTAIGVAAGKAALSKGKSGKPRFPTLTPLKTPGVSSTKVRGEVERAKAFLAAKDKR